MTLSSWQELDSQLSLWVWLVCRVTRVYPNAHGLCTCVLYGYLYLCLSSPLEHLPSDGHQAQAKAPLTRPGSRQVRQASETAEGAGAADAWWQVGRALKTTTVSAWMESARCAYARGKEQTSFFFFNLLQNFNHYCSMLPPAYSTNTYSLSTCLMMIIRPFPSSKLLKNWSNLITQWQSTHTQKEITLNAILGDKEQTDLKFALL